MVQLKTVQKIFNGYFTKEDILKANEQMKDAQYHWPFMNYKLTSGVASSIYYDGCNKTGNNTY